jgi:hypothetical protein
MTEKKLPKFFNYNEEETDNGYETIQDFYLSWTIRCAMEEYKSVNYELNKYAKHIVFALVFGVNNKQIDYEIKNYEEIKIINVKTIRQLGYIDLLAKITIEKESEVKTYILNIENKWYSNIREKQLGNSKINAKKYSDKLNTNVEIINLVIYRDYEIVKYEKTKQECINNDYKCLTIEDLKIYANIKNGKITNNALFDEYWFNS